MRRRIGRNINKRVLRVADKNELAFTATLGAFEAFLRLGLPHSMVSVGMVPLGEKTVCPAVIVKQGDKTVIHRMNDYPLDGPAEKQQQNWRAWVFALVGENADIPDATRAAMYRASQLSKEGVAEKLMAMLIANGIQPGLGI